MDWILLGLAAGAVCLVFWLTQSIKDQILTPPDLVDDLPPITTPPPIIDPPLDETIFDQVEEEMIEEIITEPELPNPAPIPPEPDSMPVIPPDPVEPDPPAEVSEDTSFDFDSGDDGDD